MRRIGFLVAAVLLTSCALKTPPAHDEVLQQALPTTPLPPAWQAGGAGTAVGTAWVKTFNDAQLDAIVAEAIAHNTDLRAAAARVEVAQQSVIVAGAAMKPQVGVQLGGRSTYDHDSGGANHSTLGYAGVAWELDVWGRLRAQQASAEYGAQAATLDYAWARESLAALTAKSWFLCIETRQLLALSEQAVVVYTDLLKLVTVRREAGRDSDLNVAVVSAKLDSARGKVEAARQNFGAAKRALETLLGRYPAAEIAIAPVFGALPGTSGASVPSALLERRADIVAAERIVFAAFRQQESAELALLPSFGLSLDAGRLSNIVTSLLSLNPWLASAAIGMSIPIYEGGALKAQVAIATAQQVQAVANYGSVTLNAFREVEDSLAAERLLAAQLPFDESSLRARTDAVRIGTVQFKAGRQDLLWVAELQTAELASQSDVIMVRAAQRANRIRLYQALGGGFGDAPEVAAATPISVR